MKAWSVAILTVCKHGQCIHARFQVSATRNLAVASAIAATLQDPSHQDCSMAVTLTHATEVGNDLIEAAAADLKSGE